MQERNSLQIFRSVLFALVLREMLTRFGARRMGAFWMLLEPMLHVIILMVIFSTIRAREVPGMDFPIYLLTGMIPFFMMRNLALRLMDAVSANQALFAYQQIKPLDTLVARIIVELSLYACVYVLMLSAMGLWFGYDISMHDPLAWFVALATGVVLSAGLGLIFCVWTQIFPNSRSFIRIMFLPVYLISGIIFPIWSFPQEYLPWILWNPYLHIVDNLRSSIFVAYPRTYGINFSYPAEVALITLFLGLGLYRLRRHNLVAI
ncbi:sugar ABC transporter permease [Bordetella petrii]|nr:sugar ABC transporter permease [Bordetella petrii]